jgi:hypothetical protein
MGALMAAVVATLAWGLRGWNPFAALALEIATGGLLYAALLLLFRPAIAREIAHIVPLARLFDLFAALRAKARGAA